MSVSNLTGLFGKLPSHGDFIYRNLPSDFIDSWDNWLQIFISSTQKQLETDWLDIYLTSPIWHFTCSPGVFDHNMWTGILLPSVDRVGRYFPFSIIKKMPETLNPTSFHLSNQDWFDAIAQIALDALQGGCSIEELVEKINAHQPLSDKSYKINNIQPISSRLLVQAKQDEDPSIQLLPNLFDLFLKQQYNSYSLWSTQGSNRIAPCMFTAQGLPSSQGIAAMLDGDWSHWQWQEPYTLNPEANTLPLVEN